MYLVENVFFSIVKELSDTHKTLGRGGSEGSTYNYNKKENTERLVNNKRRIKKRDEMKKGEQEKMNRREGLKEKKKKT